MHYIDVGKFTTTAKAEEIIGMPRTCAPDADKNVAIASFLHEAEPEKDNYGDIEIPQPQPETAKNVCSANTFLANTGA